MRSDVRIDVVVPTYRRPELLERCFRALAAQSHQPATVIVVVRIDDEDSKNLLARIADEFPALVMVEVTEPGVIAAMSVGVSRSSSPIIAFTDDDACPRSDWLARIATHLQDPTIGGVGGRDVIAGQEHPLTEKVGRFSRSGKLVGNHHLGTGGARTVDVLKGVNMAFRAEALALPAPGVLRGDGAQVDWEVLTCAWARHQGWRLVYDPAVVVDHEGAPRHGADQRRRPERRAIFDAAYNSVIAAAVLERRLPLGRIGFPIAVGTGDRPGFVRAAIAGVRGEREVLRRAPPALWGRLVAASQLSAGQRPRQRTVVVPAEVLRAGRPSQPLPVVALVAHDIHDHGGMERACAELIRRGSDTVDYIVVAADLAPELRPLVRRWVRVRVPPRPFPLKFVLFWFLAGRALRRLDADLVHTVGAIVPNRVDVSTIQFCHAGFCAVNGALAPGGSPPVRRVNTALSRWFALTAERWSYRPSRLRAFASVSRGVAAEVNRHYPTIPVAVTPNGVDVDRFQPDPDVRAEVRACEKVGDGVVALFLGGDWDRKGLGLAIEAVSIVRAGGHDLRLWVVGGGDESRFVALAEQLGVAPYVRFFGPRRDTERFYQAADIFVFPTTYEAFSLVTLEAASSGLPLVMPPVNGAEELIGDDEAGLVVERNSADVAAALTRLIINPDLRHRLGAKAHQRSSAYTWRHSAESVMRLYEQLLAGREVGR